VQIVLAYSGGLDTSVLLKQYIEAGHEVIAMTLNLGESDHRRRRRARKPRSRPCARKRSRSAQKMPCCSTCASVSSTTTRTMHSAANARYQGVYPLSAALSRPLIADLLVETAEEVRLPMAVAHGCTGKGNDQVRIEVGVRAQGARHLKALAPLREKPLSRPDAIAYAQKHGVPIRAHARQAVSRSTPTCGAARSRPASSKIRGTRRPKMPTPGPSTPPRHRNEATRS
jgi:argininosuccinate synthase